MWLTCMYIYRMMMIFFFKVQFTSDVLTHEITTKHKIY